MVQLTNVLLLSLFQCQIPDKIDLNHVKISSFDCHEMRDKIDGISLRKFCSRVELVSVTLDSVFRQTLNLYLELCAGS